MANFSYTNADLKASPAVGNARGALYRAATSHWLTGLLLLAAPLTLLAILPGLPIGSNFWDITFYTDASHRLSLGQRPHVDFMLPVGSLGFYGYWLLEGIFNDTHPALLAQWAGLFASLPVAAIVFRCALQRSPGIAYALLIPYVFFATVPLNGEATYPGSGVDAFGYYNRHVAILLYLLVATILFVRASARHVIALTIIGLGLFLTKVTGLVAGGIIVVWALAARRVMLGDFLKSLAAGTAILIAIELMTGEVSAYIRDILAMLALNKGSFIPRLPSVFAAQLDVLLLMIGISVLTAYDEWPRLVRKMSIASTVKSHSVMLAIAAVLRSRTIFLGVLFVAITVLELQNAGSLEYIAFWPLFVALVWTWGISTRGVKLFAMALIGVYAATTATLGFHRSVRVLLAAVTQHSIDDPALANLRTTTARSEAAAYSKAMYEHLSRNPAAYDGLVKRDIAPWASPTVDPAFHQIWLLSTAEAIKAIYAYETKHNIRFSTIFTIDYVNPLPAMMNRGAPKHVPLAVDPTRSAPSMEIRMLPELDKVDALLEPLCPRLPLRERVRDYFATALEGRTRIALTPCWNMYLRK